ncbi:MAG TPA: iron chelate uptake ABC transporter family permease subunit [Bacteriovoracaceae bacterium]|nr:iron chelate uptake ABC transporter family permease subunit [Bacteriovoracaceae bacterium]
MFEESVRLAASFCAGTLMSLMGSFIQLRSQNILASTSTVGLDSLSVLWILIFHSLTVILGMTVPFYGQLALGIFIFVIFGIYISKLTEKKFNLQKLLLLGLALNLFVGALYSLWQFLFLAFNFDFPTELLFGHFRFVSLDELFPVVVLLILFFAGLKRYWRELEIFSTGPEITRLAGINHQKMSRFFLVLSSVTIFLLVFLFGGFAFLGLVLPILSRGLWFRRFGLKGEFVLGGAINGVMFMLTDLICYSLPIAGAEIPVGLLSGVVGSLGLILILRKTHVW